ncbi:zf-HC2 domain-containing protein [Streptomyces sp. NPDC015127]|uniref:zf-HC2 domain-containing protein n=1 Tax=Streptomyces sp. NPDC015127 TaxID=3364939 RepID=UPI0036F958F7
MTSSTDRAGTAQHPDVSEISDLTEGLLPPSRAAEVRRHLDDCSLCADVRSSLAEIRGLLGTLPRAGRMPADIAGRIDAALAAEALLDASAPSEPAHVSRETAPPSPATEAATPAADRPAGHSRAATGPGRNRRGRRRRVAMLGAVFGAAAVGVSVILLQTVQTQSGSDSSTKEASVSADTGEFSGAPIQDRVHTLLAADTEAEPRIEKAPSLDTESTPVSPKSSPETAVPSCIQQGTGRSDRPLAFEQGRYAGVDAYLVVMAHPTDAKLVQAYVVDAACVGNPAERAGTVLHTESYPRN